MYREESEVTFEDCINTLTTLDSLQTIHDEEVIESLKRRYCEDI